MGNTLLVKPLVFLIDTLVTLYILALLLRFLLQWARADFYNPLSQFLVKITNPLLRPLRQVIPRYKGIDFGSLALILALQAIGLLVILLLADVPFSFSNILVWSLAKILILTLNLWLVLIIVQAIMSWINPRTYNPALALVHSLTEPVLAPARRIIPPISGIDLSPLLVLIVLQIIKMIVADLATWIAAPAMSLL
jgi:YggT family protein